MALFSAYAVLGITTHPGAVPAPQQVGAVAEWVFFPVLAASRAAPALPNRDLARRGAGARSSRLNFLATGLC